MYRCLLVIISFVLFNSSYVFATEYVVRVGTADDKVGKVHDYISHSILEATLYGTKGNNKTVEVYPGNHSTASGYWSNTELGKVITTYTFVGDGKKDNNSAGKIWPDRNAFWKHSYYYFRVKCDDLGDIWQLRLKTKSTENKSTKTLKIKSIDVWRGHSCGKSSYRYDYPGFQDMVIGNKYVTHHIKGYTKVAPLETVSPAAGYYGTLVKNDALKAKGDTEVTYNFESEVVSNQSSNDVITQAFSVSADINGSYAEVGASLKSQYDYSVKQEMASSLSSSTGNLAGFKRTVKPGEYVVIVGKYDPKTVMHTANISFTVNNRHLKKDQSRTENVTWTGSNPYWSIVSQTPEVYSFGQEPTKAEMLEKLKAFQNKEFLAEEFPDK